MSRPRSHGDRLGQGFGRELPKRAPCPKCGKKGVGTTKPLPSGALIRECQYCCAVFQVNVNSDGSTECPALAQVSA